jgi:hypothetical protein
MQTSWPAGYFIGLGFDIEIKEECLAIWHVVRVGAVNFSIKRIERPLKSKLTLLSSIRNLTFNENFNIAALIKKI